ncbi:hypothetical protein NMG60_11009715 [Bertholletia excelsa]
MDPILAWLRRQWNAWDVRVLVLLSLSLQIILYIFGNRRKYMVSFWISAVVWVAYLTADWVATIALSKLSDVLSEPGYDKANSGNAALRGLWAPLLLVHLGGPDTITAYSLEDNRLWPRHWLSLFVQAAVALYAILLSWRFNFWISFLTFPALWLDTLKTFMEQYDLYRSFSLRFGNSKYLGDDSVMWKAMECELGLMYDLLYTKASVIYTKAGFFLRCISLVCTISLTVGFICFVSDMEKWKDEYNIAIPDIAVTGALIIGTMVLETYATVLSFSTDWAVIWTEAKRGIVGHPCCVFNDRRRWSNVMGQFNLYESWENGRPSRSWKGSGLMLELHKTCIPVPPNIRSKILGFIRSLDSCDDEDLGQKLCGGLLGFGSSEFGWGILALHLITELFYKNKLQLLEKVRSGRNPAFGSTIKPSEYDRDTRETCRILSNYMMYLLLLRSSMLPIVGVEAFKKTIIGDSSNTRDTLLDLIFSSQPPLPSRILDSFHRMIDTASSPSTSNSSSPWVVLTNAWLAILLYTAKECKANEHLQQLRRGGELLTILWFLLPQSDWFLDVSDLSPVINAKLNFIFGMGP